MDDRIRPDVLDQRAKRAEEIDADVFEKAPVFGGERRLDHMVGDFVERHGIVEIDAALADHVAVAILERDRELIEGQPVLAVDLFEGRQGEDIEHDEAAGTERQAL